MRGVLRRTELAGKWRLVLALGAAGVATCSTFTVYRIQRLDLPNRSVKLANGLRVAIQPDASQARALLTLRYDVGAAFEPADRKGLAHFTEHLAFRLGDELVQRAAPAAASAGKTGGKGGQELKRYRHVRYLATENAYTTHDETVYWKRVGHEHVGDVLADFALEMGDFTAKISDEVFATEKNVVHNERRHRYEGRPLDRVWLDFAEQFYLHGHPYHGAVIGTHESIDAITRADVASFLRQHYHPGNATLVITGPVDPAATLELVLRHFGGKPKREPSLFAAPTHERDGQREPVTVRVPEAKEAMVTVAWPLGKRFSDEAVAARLIDEAAGGWFHHRLVTNRGWAYWAWSWVDEGDYDSAFVVQALLRDPRHVDEVKHKIIEIADLMDSEAEPHDIAKARRQVIYRKLYGVEDPARRAEEMALYFSRRGRPIAWVDEMNGLEDVDLEAVRTTAGRLLTPARAFVLVHLPAEATADDALTPSYSEDDAKKARDVQSAHEDRERLPPLYDFSQKLEVFAQAAGEAAGYWERARAFTLANGITCRVMQAGDLPVMSVTAALRGGDLAEPKEVHGVGEILLFSMSIRGRAASENQWRMGGEGFVDTDAEAATYSRKFPSFYAEDGLRLFAELITDPQILQTTVADQRERLLQARFANRKVDLDYLATRAFWRARGLEEAWPMPTARTMAQASLAAVRRYRDHIAYPENLILTVSSDRPVAEVERLLERTFAGWAKSGRKPVAAPADLGGRAVPAQIVVVPVASHAQSKIMLGFDTAGWRDWQAHALAEGVSYLLEEKAKHVREAMGVTYDVSAGVWSLKERGVLYLSSKVERGATGAAVRQLNAVVDELRASPVTASELELVRRKLIDERVDVRRDRRAESERLAALALRERPLDYDRQYVAWAAALDVSTVEQALRTLLSGPGLWVVVGDELAELPPPQRKLTRIEVDELL